MVSITSVLLTPHFRRSLGSAKLRGASTITQQLAKSLLIAHEGFEKGTERSIRRKLKEAILANRLEGDLNKEEIIWLYLNQVYSPRPTVCKLQPKAIFEKNVEELNLAEMSLLLAPRAQSVLTGEQSIFSPRTTGICIAPYGHG